MAEETRSGDSSGTGNLITFRAFDSLRSEFAARAGQEGRTILSNVARRDLERYYHALGETLRTVTLSEREALLICDALNGTLVEPHTAQLLWAQIDDAIRLDGLADKWEVDGPALVARLRTLSYCQALAVTDAVERWWAAGPRGDRAEALRAVGLVR
jgi:hypothetical protein